jgi:hypothetical protein
LFSLYLVANGLRDALDPDSQQFKAAKKAKAKAAKKEKAA